MSNVPSVQRVTSVLRQKFNQDSIDTKYNKLQELEDPWIHAFFKFWPSFVASLFSFACNKTRFNNRLSILCLYHNKSCNYQEWTHWGQTLKSGSPTIDRLALSFGQDSV